MENMAIDTTDKAIEQVVDNTHTPTPEAVQASTEHFLISQADWEEYQALKAAKAPAKKTNG